MSVNDLLDRDAATQVAMFKLALADLLDDFAPLGLYTLALLMQAEAHSLDALASLPRREGAPPPTEGT